MHDEMSHSPSDPLGHYSALGVGPLADAAEIKTAYRHRAKTLHPDYNPSEEAAQDFLHVVEAYRILRDPKRREHYDSTLLLPAPVGLIDPEDPEPEPLTCSRCGKVTAQPRYIIFHKVKSYLIKTRRSAIRGIFCRDCADRTAIRASTGTWVTGWWGVTGPFHTLRALWRNLRGGDLPRADNLWVLLHQSRAFLARGDNDIARALAEQAQHFAKDDQDRIRIAQLATSAGEASRKLINRWHPWGHAAWVQALPLAS